MVNARTCCTCHDEPLSRDACMCGCGYLNGIAPIIATQMLVMIGLLFSLAALGDCSFVEIEERFFFPPSDNTFQDLPIIITQAGYIGFLTWQKLDGSCYWYNVGPNPENQVDLYFDLLGQDWQIPRVFGGIATTLSFYSLLYLSSFICSAQVRGIRYFVIFFLSIVLVICQGLTFLVFDTTLCQEKGCTFSRGAGFSVAAMGSFFLSGIPFFWTRDYPGDRFAGINAITNKHTLDEQQQLQEQQRQEQQNIGVVDNNKTNEAASTMKSTNGMSKEIADTEEEEYYHEEVVEEVDQHGNNNDDGQNRSVEMGM